MTSRTVTVLTPTKITIGLLSNMKGQFNVHFADENLRLRDFLKQWLSCKYFLSEIHELNIY